MDFHNIVFQRICARAAIATILPQRIFFDASGTIFGTAQENEIDAGFVFRLSPPAAGLTTWTETDIYHFQGSDGENPNSLVRFDKSGPIFGTTTTHVTQNSVSIGWSTS